MAVDRRGCIVLNMGTSFFVCEREGGGLTARSYGIKYPTSRLYST